jgi:hypothetical protein
LRVEAKTAERGKGRPTASELGAGPEAGVRRDRLLDVKRVGLGKRKLAATALK